MDADGSNAQIVTPDTIRESHPAWSADGKRLFYLATRGKVPRLFSVDRLSGEPIAVTDSLHPVQDFAIGPDGKNLIYSMVKNEQVDLVPAVISADGTADIETWTPFNTKDDEIHPHFAAKTGDLFFIRRQIAGKRGQTLMRYKWGSTVVEPVTMLPDQVIDFAVSPEGDRFVVQEARRNPKTGTTKNALYALELRPGGAPIETVVYEDPGGDAGAPAFAP
jgi:Tol biopolymer transport system component